MAIGTQIAGCLKKGDVVALRGPLGAGKTCLVKGIALGLGVKEEVTSPTYTIISEYEVWDPSGGEAKIPFYHIDAYRLRGDDDFYSLGGGEILEGDGISAVEWSERIPESLPSGVIIVEIELCEGEKRLIRVNRGRG
jgi:tRNA threonylcarbamoyladenosine biosynthesis protein TsaE